MDLRSPIAKGKDVSVSFLSIDCRPLELLNFNIAFVSLVLTESPREVSEPRNARIQDCHEEACQDDMHTDSALFLDNILHKDFYKHQFGVKKSAHQARLDLRRSPSGAKMCRILLLEFLCFFLFLFHYG